jgi:hypothetical protein
MRSRFQVPGRPLCAALAAGGLVAALAVTAIAAPRLAANQSLDPAGQTVVPSQPADPTGPGQMPGASQPADYPRPVPRDPRPPAPAPSAPDQPEPVFDDEVEGVVRPGSVNIAKTGPGAETFVLSTGQHGDVTVHFPGVPAGAPLGPQEVGTVAQLQDGTRLVVQGRLGSDAQTFEATRVELVTEPTKQVAQGTFVLFGNGKLSILVNGLQKSYTITGDTTFRPVDKSAANLVGLAGGTRVTVVSEGDVAKGVVIFPR